MSQYPPALNYTLNFEDPNRVYSWVPDIGGFAIAGINSAAWPTDYANIAAAPQNQRAQLVYDFYQKNFWNPMKIGGFSSQDIANRVFDEGVNASSSTSIHLFQRAVIVCGISLVEDGVNGPKTMEAANSIDEEKLLAAFRTQRLRYYKKIVDNNTQDEKYFAGWEKRALS